MVLAQAAHDLEPVDAREHDVEHGEVGRALGGEGHCLEPVEGNAGLVAGALEVAGDDLADRGLVVDDQDRRAAGGGLG